MSNRFNRIVSWLDAPRSTPRSRFTPHDFRPPATSGRGLDTRHWARGLDR